MGSATAQARAERRVGTVLAEKWRLDSVLGIGGMAAVYAATHRAGKRFAIKVLHSELALEDDIRARFQREAYAANRVEHPDALSVLDDDVTEDGAPFLVMELLSGETLDARWERKGRRLPPDEVLALADQILDVLIVAHAAGVVHRDLKPENVFLTDAGRVKILDFGIARLREGPAATKTSTGSLLGTPAFMAPEQARGRWESVDARTDLWAVGASLFTLLSGRFVHDAPTVNELLLSAMTEPAPRLATVVADAQPWLGRVVDRALAFDPADRWQDARAMQEAVRVAYHGDPESASVSVPRLDPSRIASEPTAPPAHPPAAREAALTTSRGTSLSGTSEVSSVDPSPRHRVRAASVVVAGACLVLALGATALVRSHGEPESLVPSSERGATSAPGAGASAPSTSSDLAGERRDSSGLAPSAVAIDALPPVAPLGAPRASVGSAPVRTPMPHASAVRAVTPAPHGTAADWKDERW